MSTQESQTSLFFSTLPPASDLVAFTFRINSSSTGTDSAFSSVQQCCMGLALNAPSFLISPVDQTSLSTQYAEPKRRLLLITSCGSAQTEEYREKLNAFRLTEPCRVTDVSYQLVEECFRFTLCSRLSPKWNRFGTMLVQGEEFLQAKRTQTLLAVRLEANVRLRELCISLVPYSVTYRPLDVMDVLNMSQERIMPNTLESVQLLFGKNLSIKNIRCQVLPNLTRAYIHSITREPLRSSPLRDHSAVREYWKSVHGYQLPQEGTSYVNVSFQSRSSHSLTYPLPCVITENSLIWRYSPASAEWVSRSFMQDSQERMPSFCGYQLSFSQRARPSVEYQTPKDTDIPRPNTQGYTTTPIAKHAPLTQPIQSTHSMAKHPNVPPQTERYKPCFKVNPLTHPIGDKTTQSSIVQPQTERYKPCFKVNPVKKPEPQIQLNTPKQHILPAPSSSTFSSSLPPVPSLTDTGTPQSSATIHPKTQCFNVNRTVSEAQHETSILRVPTHSLSTVTDPPAKKQKVARPSVRLEDLATAGQLGKASIPNLAEWLREKKISFRAKDKKAQLISLVQQHLILMSEP